MLHIVIGTSGRFPLIDKSVRDDERGIGFTFIGTMAMGTIDAFTLTWDGRVIPVEARLGLIGEHYETGYVLYTDPRVTGSVAYTSTYGIPSYVFASEEEEREARSIARECLLVFGESYNGLSKPEGKVRVRKGAQELTLNDFGY